VTERSAEVLEIVRLAVACGACDSAGPLSHGELALAKAAGRAPRRSAQKVVSAIRDGGDPLGDAFCAAEPVERRRKFGAFYTGSTIVDSMIGWALERRPSRLVDAGCGSGRFAVAAAKRDRSVELVAVDHDPAATLMTRAALCAVGARRARVLQEDYLFVQLGAARGATAFVGNPPYVRHHHIGAAAKARAADLASRMETPLSGLAGLHALFYLATSALHARRGDFGSFVTSAEWLDVGYGAMVRHLFANELGGESLDVFNPHCTPFADVMTTAAITTFCVGSRRRWARLSAIASTGLPFALGRGRRVRRRELGSADRWSALVKGDGEPRAAARIGSLFRVSRGQVTGANDYFVMSRLQARSRGLERFCVPLISHAREILEAGAIVENSPERMVGLEIPPQTDLSRDGALAAYLRAGETAKIHEGYVASRRKPWYAIRFPRPPIVATYMARQAPRFAGNPDRLGLLNVVHGLYPHQPLDDSLLALAVARLNANREAFVGKGRTYHGGLEKFEPREMENLPLDLSP
jgi:SAM-dependent methyltransferase